MTIETLRVIYTTIQIIGWVELIILFALLPFETQHEYIYKLGNWVPNLFAGICFVLVVGIPIMLAGIFACLTYFAFLFFLWLITK